VTDNGKTTCGKGDSHQSGQNDTVFGVNLRNRSFFPLCMVLFLQIPEKCQNQWIIWHFWTNKLGMVIAK